MSQTADILERADAEAEGLLGFVRMAIAATLGTVVFLAVGTTGRPASSFIDSQLFIAIAIIASYFLLGLITVVVVRACMYRMWMAWVTASLDVLLIAANIWTGFTNAGASSLFALAFPAAMMVPIILAFGALRYRPAIQLTMTLLLGSLIAAITFSGPYVSPNDDQAINYLKITYGIPPNIMRVVMIVAAGLVIAVATWRAKQLLWQVASQSEQRANLTRFLPRGIAVNLTDAKLTQLRRGQQSELAIMFIDIRGFTHLAEHLPPEKVSRLLGEFRSHVLDAVEAHQGVVDKFIGDGALVLFGLNGSRDHPADHAVRAATELIRDIDRWNGTRGQAGEPEIAVGIGLHYGTVVIGAIGDSRRLEFTVIGDEVNVASRVEQATKALNARILATGAVIERAESVQPIEWHDLGDTELRGRDTPVRLWAYHGLSTGIAADVNRNRGTS